MESVVKFPRYDSYKDSGVDWLGEIPAHWNVKKTKFLWREHEQRSLDGKEQLLSVSQYYGVVPKKNNSRSESLVDYKRCGKQNLVVNIMLAWLGGLGVTDYDGIVSPAYCVYRQLEDNNAHYLNYLYPTSIYLAEFARRSKGVVPSRWRMYTEDFGQVLTLLPLRNEQDRITSFLDQKTAEIDKAIAKKQRLIELLKEQKAILINQAVTRGLNPDVPMRDSGVGWIGEIPEHWGIKRLRYIGTTQNGISAGAEYFGTGHPFVSYSDVYNNRELPCNVKGLAKSSVQDRKQYSVEKGDILFTRTSETIEEIGFASTCMETIENATFAGFLIRFRPQDRFLISGYSNFYFSAQLHREYFVGEMNLVIRASLSQELLKKLPVIIPPKMEQKKIFDFLETISTKFENAVILQEQQIDRLKEYKSILIANAVTGKIKI